MEAKGITAGGGVSGKFGRRSHSMKKLAKHNAAVRLCRLLAVLISVVSAISGHAAAQVIGSAVGSELQQEHLDCLAGKPPIPLIVRSTRRSIEETMDDYFALSSTATSRQISRVFATDRADVHWKDSSGQVPLDQLGARLDTPTPKRMLIEFVADGDWVSAHAIWSVEPASGSDIAYYAVDFANEGWFGGGWKIWHMQAFSSSAKPSLRPIVCHFDPTQGF
jgi:hypothetical protein